MLHRAEFGNDPLSTMTANLQLAKFIRQCNLQRENIINVQEMENGNVVLWYWQELHR